MKPVIATFAILIFAAPGLLAQTAPPRSVQASGNATIYATPDQAPLDVGVVTNGSTAQDSAQQNATMTTAVLTALKAVLGSSGTVQTVSYYVHPRYSPTPTQPSVIVEHHT